MTMTTDITKALQTMQDTVLPPLTHHATIDRPSLVILYSTALLFAFSLSATHSVKYYFVIYLGGKLSDVVYTFMIFSFVGCLAPFVASFAMTKLNPRYTYRPLFVMCSIIAIISDIVWFIASDTSELLISRGLAAIMLVAWGLAYLHVIDMASDLPPDLKTGITVGYMAYAILGVMLGAFASLVFAFIPDSVKLFGNPLKYVLPAYIDAILRVPYTIYMIWKLKPLKNIKYGTAVPALREQFQQMENPAAYFNAGLLFIVAFIARSFSEVYAPLYGASNPAVFVWDLWTNSLYFTLLSLICMVLLKPTSLKLVCRPFYLVTRNLGCWKYRNAEGTVLVNGAVFFMILALVGCLVLIDYTYQPTASSGSASSSVISLGQFIVGISLIYLFGGALMYEATGGMAQHVPVQSPHAFFLGAATSFQMIGRTIGPIWAGIACAGFSPEAWVNTTTCTTGNYPIYGLIGVFLLTSVILIVAIRPLLIFEDAKTKTDDDIDVVGVDVDGIVDVNTAGGNNMEGKRNVLVEEDNEEVVSC